MKGHAKCTRWFAGARERAGFTLIELMLVIIIIGIIVSIAVPRLAGRTERARNVAAKATITSLSSAIDSFEVDVGRFPTTEEGLAALVSKPSSLPTEATWNGPYMREIPLDPWNREYTYKYPGDLGVDYDLICMGPDGQSGSADDITNIRRQDQR
jgi:general secretion pathway protein G